MNKTLSVYRIYVSKEYKERLYNILTDIEPKEGKIVSHNTRETGSIFDLVLNKEELAFIKLTIPNINELWLQEYIHVEEQ